MTEDLLQYIWQTRQFDEKDLTATDGSRIFIIHPGYHNRDAGPDFLHAKIRIGTSVWAGHVELHVRSSDWIAHRHSEDAAYQNVVLHVVFIHDTEIRAPGQIGLLPTIELKPRISGSLIRLYQQFYLYQTSFPCEAHFSAVDPELVSLTIQRMGVERLEEKAERIHTLFTELHRDWWHVLLVLVGRSLAGPVNSDSMEDLLKRTDPRWLLRTKDKLIQIESLLLGTAGLLSGDLDEYGLALKREYEHWKQKHPISEMNAQAWKYSRMRPENFIDIRIAQFAYWIHGNDSAWSKIISCENYRQLRSIFNIQLRHYWSAHFRLGKEATRNPRKLGDSTVHVILINAIAPLLFLYGKENDLPELQERAMLWLMEIPPENNKLVRAWDILGQRAGNGFESQGLLYWKKAYCDKKACARCPVGQSILKACLDDPGV